MLILLYVHDSLRHDFVGSYNGSESNTPSMDALATDAVLFERAYAQTTWTKASAASMLTSIYPQSLGVEKQRAKAPAEAFSLLKSMQMSGFRTLALSTNSFVSKRFGFDAGFSEIPDLFELEEFQSRPRRQVGSKRGGTQREGNPYITTKDLNRLFIPYLDHYETPTLALLWSMDTHLPYFDRNRLEEYGKGLTVVTKNQIRKTSTALLLELYRGMIQYADSHFGKLIQAIRERGLYDNSMIIVLGDHGESFGENGQFTHAGDPYEEQIHVPLIIKFPGQAYAGQRPPGIAELVDVMPTVLEIIGIDLELESIQGRSLLPLIAHSEGGRSWAYSSINSSALSPGTATIVSDEFQYIRKSASNNGITLKQVGGVRSTLKWIWERALRPLMPSQRTLISIRQGGKVIRTARWRKEARHRMDEFDILLDEINAKNLEIRQSWKHPAESAELDARVRSRLEALGYLEE